MRKFSIGLITGLLVGLMLASATLAFGASPIKLIINGQEITCDTPPQMINGRAMVPARYVAEALGATVTWDSSRNAVVITSKSPSSAGIISTKEGVNVNQTTFNGMEAIEVNGKVYFMMGEYYRLIRGINADNDISYDPETQTGTIMLNGTTTVIDLTSPENAIQYQGINYLSTKYYQPV